MEAEQESESLAVAAAELHITATESPESPNTGETEEPVSGEQQKTVLKHEEGVSTGNSTSEELGTPTHLTCLTIKPNRVLCGVRLELFYINANFS